MRKLTGCMAAAVLTLSTTAQAALIGIAGSNVIEIDENTGDSAILATGAPVALNAAAADDLGRVVVVRSEAGGVRTLGSVDPLTGVFTPVVTLDSAIDVRGLAFDSASGNFFAVADDGNVLSNDRLVSIDPATGAVTDIGDLGGDEFQSATFSPSGELLIASFTGLFEVNVSTAATTELFSFSSTNIQALEFVSDGRLIGGNDDLFVLDIVNESLSLFTDVLGDNDDGRFGPGPEFADIRGLAFIPDNDNVSEVPLPGALPLMLAGFGGLAAAARRRRKSANA